MFRSKARAYSFGIIGILFLALGAHWWGPAARGILAAGGYVGASPVIDSVGPSPIKPHLVRTLAAPGSVTAIAWSPDSGQLAAASQFGGVLTVWSSNGNVINQFKSELGVPRVESSLEFSAGSSELLFYPKRTKSGVSGAMSVYDIATGRVIATLPSPRPNDGFALNAADAFAESADQHYVVVAPALGNYIAIYSAPDWRLIRTIDVGSPASSVAISSDGSKVAVGSTHGTAFAYESLTGKLLEKLVLPDSDKINSSLAAIAMSPDGRFVAVGVFFRYADADNFAEKYSPIGAVQEYELSDGKRVASLDIAAPPIYRIEWDQRGDFVAVADGNKHVILWRASSGSTTNLIEASSALSVAIAPNGKHLAVARNGEVQIFDLGNS